MKRHLMAFVHVAVALACLVLTGCAVAPTKPLYIDPTLAVGGIDSITILPTFVNLKQPIAEFDSRRVDEKILGKNFFEAVFRGRGYAAKTADSYGERAQMSADALDTAAPDWVKSLGPAGSRWLFLAVIEDVTSESKMLGQLTAVECSGYLFDTATGSIPWRHKALGHGRMGGLQGAVMSAGGWKASDFGPSECIIELLRGLPSKEPGR